MRRSYGKLILVSVLLIAAAAIFTYSTRHVPVDFNTQIKPILNKQCITCHGGVRKKAGFSVLFRKEALANTESGKPAIIPGKPEESEFIRRLTLKDPEERMPYQHPPLSEDDIHLLYRWIKEGAVYGEHWAYQPVKKEAVPEPDHSFFDFFSSEKKWGSSPIDHFILEKLKEQELTPSPEADKYELLRRVSLDLTGLPAPKAIAERYLKDNSPAAYDTLVSELLASPHFGERWASMWLDLARYADTKGYERDDGRNIWRYRDWLINAFNADKPYDKFLIEQLAGDLLPGATDQQLIATAFQRNTMTNDEGGTDNEEFRTAAVIDRVNTTWEALMGTTFACVQCHTHPYDPFTHDEYYKFMAFFNDTRDEDTNDDYPLLRHFDSAAAAKFFLVRQWLQHATTEDNAKHFLRFLKTWQPSINSLTADQFINSELADTKWLVFRNHAVARLKKVTLTGRSELVYRYNGFLNDGAWQIHLDSSTGPVIARSTVKQTKGWTIELIPLAKTEGVHDLYLTYSNPRLHNPDQNGVMFDWFHFAVPFPGEGEKGYEEAFQNYWSLLLQDLPGTPIMMDNPPALHRETHVFERGNWLVKGDLVEPATPASLNPFPANAPKNRLGLAKWMTDKKNPLTSRTIVNRIWEQFFGTGLAETLEDLGTQGSPPTHRKLLDYLSWQLMYQYNWSLKSLMKEIVLSGTYRQDSKTTAEALAKDPKNKFYARSPRVRLSAEQLRDEALSVSGLLSDKMFGPSVMPTQPEGIWLSPWNGQTWVKSQGEDQYRRAIYTYWKRTAPYPSMMAFDGASREVCTPRRIQTNTPLQALVTLNDEAFLETARHFAYRMQKEGGNNFEDQIRKGYDIAFHHPIGDATFNALKNLYNAALVKFKADPEQTCNMVGVMDQHNNPQTAAMVVVANAMMNLDEFITKN